MLKVTGNGIQYIRISYGYTAIHTKYLTARVAYIQLKYSYMEWGSGRVGSLLAYSNTSAVHSRLYLSRTFQELGPRGKLFKG